MNSTPWSIIDSQADLDRFNQSVCWEDTSTVEYYGTLRNEPHFPNEVSRSGFANKNVHLLCDTSRGCVQMVFIDCDWLSSTFLEHPFFTGRVDSLKRVEVMESDGAMAMRCSRLIYRFVADLASGSPSLRDLSE